MSNEKRTITQQQHDNLLDALHNMWPSVPPENVFPGLRQFGALGRWRRSLDQKADCGTVACFGGWCAYWPAFQAQGVQIDEEGYPTHPKARTRFSFDVSRLLFGSRDLFDVRGDHPADAESKGHRGITDHQLVTNRLTWELANTQVAA